MWESYARSFNKTFCKEYIVSDFIQEYTSNFKKESYHSLILDGEMVVGGCSAIPYMYIYFGKERAFALFVDENYRRNEFILFDAYTITKAKLIEDSILFIISVPNDKAYGFWKKIAGWKDIGSLTWYVMPLRAGNINNNIKLLNISCFIFYCLSFLCRIFSVFFNKRKRGKIFLEENSEFMKLRFSDSRYNSVKDSPIHYSVISEDGIRVAYLLSESFFSFLDISRTVWHIINKENIDIIIYIGNINCHQILLFKLPKRFEPRKMHFCDRKLIEENFDNNIFKLNNWDFGLLNFDVR
jgi:hypothetical protein